MLSENAKRVRAYIGREREKRRREREERERERQIERNGISPNLY